MDWASASTEAVCVGPVVLIGLDDIAPSPNPLRRTRSEDGVEQLASSIAERGILHPLLVRRASPSSPRYEVIAGERRRRAAVKIGLAHAPCVVWDVDGAQALVLSIVENLQREDFHPLDEAWAYDRLIELGVARSRADIARLLGVTRARITQRMKLLELDEGTKEKLILYSSTLSEYHARLLLSIASLDARHHMAQVAGERGLSGRELRSMIEGMERQTSLQAWREADGPTSVSPRSYQARLPGMRLFIDYGRVDRRRALEALRRAVAGLASQPAPVADTVGVRAPSLTHGGVPQGCEAALAGGDHTI